MKKIVLVSWLWLIGLLGYAQVPVYSFATVSDTAIEANTLVIAGYIRVSSTCLSPDSVLVVMQSGSPRVTHIDTSAFVAHFNIGQDSVPFLIRIYDDTFPERPDHLRYVLRSSGAGAVIGSDSLFDFTLMDNDLPATISFVTDSGYAYLHDGSYAVCEIRNNPNPFYVRYAVRTYDRWNYPLQTAYGGYDYFYDWTTAYAPPGISTRCEDIRIVPDTAQTPATKVFICAIQNIDDNILIDSFFHFTIINDNFFTPPSAYFDAASMIIHSDTAMRVGIPITIINPNHQAVTFRVDTGHFSSNLVFDTSALSHFSIANPVFTRGGGTWHDTLWLHITQPAIVSDTADITLVLRGINGNSSPDTIFHLTISGPDSLYISFLGAGFAHLKSDSIGYVQVVTNSPVGYPVSASVRYLNGSATPGLDFIFHDTTIVFRANASDTISLPVIMLHDHLREGNEQVNLQLTNISPATVIPQIIQYTYTIIDDDSTAALPSGLDGVAGAALHIYPNPASGPLHIAAGWPSYSVQIVNALGETVINLPDIGGDIALDIAMLPTGIYVVNAISKEYVSRVKLVKE